MCFKWILQIFHDRIFLYYKAVCVPYLCSNIDVFPPSSNSPEANLQNKYCKVIDLSTADLAYQGFEILG